MPTTIEEYVAWCSTHTAEEAYLLFEDGLSEDLRCAIYGHAPAGSTEPYNDALDALGVQHADC